MQPAVPTHAARDMDIIRQAIDWSDAGNGVAMATVIETWGSAPRPIGSQVVINGDGAFAGSVSGGCIEGEVVTEAHGVIRNRQTRLLTFQVSDETATGSGLACGGRVQVLVTPVSGETCQTLKNLIDLADRKLCAALVYDMESGAPTLHSSDPPAPVQRRMATDRSGLIEETDGKTAFARVYSPPRRLLIIGAVHLAQALATLGSFADYDVTVIDPRDTWGTPDRFPNVRLDRRWPATALEDLAPDRATAVVVLSHDPKLDDPVLMRACQSKAFYVGALGSRKTHAKRVARLQESGLSEADITRIHAPVGLDIGANTPFEIAVSIMGQIIKAHRRTP